MGASASFRILPLQIEARFLETFFVEIMQQIARCIFGQRGGQVVQPRENAHEIRFRLGIHIGHSGFQLQQGVEQRLFRIGHAFGIPQIEGKTKIGVGENH